MIDDRRRPLAHFRAACRYAFFAAAASANSTSALFIRLRRRRALRAAMARFSLYDPTLIEFECCPPLRALVCFVVLKDETWAKKVPFHLSNWARTWTLCGTRTGVLTKWPLSPPTHAVTSASLPLLFFASSNHWGRRALGPFVFSLSAHSTVARCRSERCRTASHRIFRSSRWHGRTRMALSSWSASSRRTRYGTVRKYCVHCEITLRCRTSSGSTKTTRSNRADVLRCVSTRSRATSAPLCS